MTIDTEAMARNQLIRLVNVLNTTVVHQQKALTAQIKINENQNKRILRLEEKTKNPFDDIFNNLNNR